MSAARLWQPATVLAVEPGRVIVRFDSVAQCQRCLQGEGCGAGVFSRLFASQPGNLELASDQNWRVGQRVQVGLTPGELAGSALRLYGLPLIAFIGGAMVGQALVPSGMISDLAALAIGLVAAALAIRLSAHRRWRGVNPVVEPLSCNSVGSEA